MFLLILLLNLFLDISNINAKSKISVITSLYKGERFIKGFMENIVSQTIFNELENGYPKVELIIIDCNLQSKEFETIKEYLDKYKNIKYINLTKDPGLYAAWNTAINNSDSDYITNANVDDRISNDCLEYHSKFLDNNNKIDFTYSDNYITFTENESFEDFQKNKLNLSDHIWFESSAEFSPAALVNGGVSGNHPMWRRINHEKAGLFNEDLKVVGDYEMWQRFYLAGCKFKKANGVHGLYYRNPDGLSSNMSKMEFILDELKQVHDKFKDLIK